MIYSTLKLM